MKNSLIRRFASLLLILTVVLPATAKRPGSTSGGIDYKAKQSLPIKLGTSGGWGLDLANGYCCGGTLGSLIEDKSDHSLHILSNFHVLAADVVAGGNGIAAVIGDPYLGQVIQPGLIDVGCNLSNAQTVAVLSGAADPLGSMSPRIDAATAQIAAGMVDASGAILGIGSIANETLPVSGVTTGMGVKKSGRTTGLTHSTIAFLNVSVTVAYEDECAGSSRGSATFTGQLVANNSGSSFLDSGDSGSLMVEEVGTTPRAVGLLFAGSAQYAIANPIDDVLARFNASMVGVTYVADSGGGDSGGSNSSPGKGRKPRSNGGQSGLERALTVQSSNAERLGGIDNSNGHGIGVDATGQVYIAVFVESLARGPRNLPATLDGIPVRVVEMGRVVAF